MRSLKSGLQRRDQEGGREGGREWDKSKEKRQGTDRGGKREGGEGHGEEEDGLASGRYTPPTHLSLPLFTEGTSVHSADDHSPRLTRGTGSNQYNLLQPPTDSKR